MSSKNSRASRASATRVRIKNRKKITIGAGSYPPMVSKLDRYARRAFDFIERIDGMRTQEEVGRALAAELEEFGFEYVTVWTVPPPGNEPSGPLFNTRPDEYVKRYVDCDYVLRDPVVTHLRTTLTTFSWSDVKCSRPLSNEELRIMDEARDFNVTDGLIVPIATLSGSLAIVSPCGRAPDVSPRARRAVSMVSVFGHQSLTRLNQRNPRGDQTYEPLSAREREVMQLVAFGKSDADISEILNLRPTTIFAHVESARRKLGTPNRPAAVAMALKRGEISG